MNKKLVLFIVSIILVGSSLIYFYNQSNKLKVSDQEKLSDLLTYNNTIGRYTLKYPSTIGIQFLGETESEEDAYHVYFSPQADLGSPAGLDLQIVYPYFSTDFEVLKSEEEAVENIVGYFSSSTSRYLYPENNTISDTVLKNGQYRSEISWKNDDTGLSARQGTDVWYVIPLTANPYPLNDQQAKQTQFLLASFPIEYVEIYEPIVSSITKDLNNTN